MYSILFLDIQKTILTSYHYNILENIAKDKILLQVLCDSSEEKISQMIDQMISEKKDLLFLVDCDESIAKWTAMGATVIAWSHEENRNESLMASPYMVLSLEALTYDYLEEIYCRRKKLPLTILTSHRCYLRELTLEDYPLLLSLDQSQALDSAGRFFPSNLCQEEKEEYLAQYISKQYPFYGFGIYAAFDFAKDCFLGIAGFSPYDPVNPSNETMENDTSTQASSQGETEDILWVEIGYAVKKEYRRQGYAKEWICGLKKWMEEYYDPTPVKIVAKIAPDNLASIQTADRCGVTIIIQ